MNINLMDLLDIIPDDSKIRINFGNDGIQNKFKIVYDLMLFQKNVLFKEYDVLKIEYINDYYDIYVILKEVV